jgi:hypothetical protein
MGRDLARAALVGVGSRGETGKMGETWPVRHWWALVRGPKLEKSFFCQGRMSKISNISSARKQFFKDFLILLCVRGYYNQSGPRFF